MKKNERIEVIYLHSDGHAVIVYSKQDKDCGEIRYCDVYESFANMSSKGRLIIDVRYNNGWKTILENADDVQVINDSSNKTKDAGVSVYLIRIFMKKGGSISIPTLPNFYSSGFTYQEDNNDKFDPDAYSWGGYPIRKIIRKTS